jgi:hypothetical protein
VLPESAPAAPPLHPFDLHAPSEKTIRRRGPGGFKKSTMIVSRIYDLAVPEHETTPGTVQGEATILAVCIDGVGNAAISGQYL